MRKPKGKLVALLAGAVVLVTTDVTYCSVFAKSLLHGFCRAVLSRLRGKRCDSAHRRGVRFAYESARQTARQKDSTSRIPPMRSFQGRKCESRLRTKLLAIVPADEIDGESRPLEL